MTGKAPTWKDHSREELHALMARDWDFCNADHRVMEKANPDHHREDHEAGFAAAKTAARDSNPHGKGTPRWESWDRGWEAGHVSELHCAAMREGEAAGKAGEPRGANPYIGINVDLLEWWDRRHCEAEKELRDERESGYRGGVIGRLAGRERETQDHHDFYTESARGWDDAGRDGWIADNWEIVKNALMREGEICAMGIAGESGVFPDGDPGPHAGPYFDMGGRFRAAVLEGFYRFHGGEAAYKSHHGASLSGIEGNPHEEGTDEWTWWRRGFIFMEGSIARSDAESSVSMSPEGNPHAGEEGAEWDGGWMQEDGILSIYELPPEIADAKRRLEEEFGVIGRRNPEPESEPAT